MNFLSAGIPVTIVEMAQDAPGSRPPASSARITRRPPPRAG
ncbi:MAG: hypothetical protein PGN08_09585 [Sphingomonas taxi]